MDTARSLLPTRQQTQKQRLGKSAASSGTVGTFSKAYRMVPPQLARGASCRQSSPNPGREFAAHCKLTGVVLVVVGSLVMHRKLFAVSWFEPVRAVFREKGSRYMLLVGLILSVSNPLDKKLVLMSDAFTQALAYGVGLCILFSFSLLVVARRADTWGVIRAAPGWVVIAGALDASVLLLQFSSHNYIDVVITISIKRAGIVLAVLFGWLFFRERNINDKLIAASVMLAGVLILYLPMTLAHALALGCSALGGMTVALYWTRGSACC